MSSSAAKRNINDHDSYYIYPRGITSRFKDVPQSHTRPSKLNLLTITPFGSPQAEILTPEPTNSPTGRATC